MVVLWIYTNVWCHTFLTQLLLCLFCLSLSINYIYAISPLNSSSQCLYHIILRIYEILCIWSCFFFILKFFVILLIYQIYLRYELKSLGVVYLFVGCVSICYSTLFCSNMIFSDNSDIFFKCWSPNQNIETKFKWQSLSFNF